MAWLLKEKRSKTKLKFIEHIMHKKDEIIFYEKNFIGWLHVDFDNSYVTGNAIQQLIKKKKKIKIKFEKF